MEVTVTRKPHHKKQTKGPIHPVIQHLRKIREEQNISQLKMAALLDCTRSKVEHLETGWTRNPSFTFLAQYAKVLGVEITVTTPDP